MNQIAHYVIGEHPDGITPLLLPVASREAGQEMILMLTGIVNPRVITIENVSTTLSPLKMTQLDEKTPQ